MTKEFIDSIMDHLGKFVLGAALNLVVFPFSFILYLIMYINKILPPNPYYTPIPIVTVNLIFVLIFPLIIFFNEKSSMIISSNKIEDMDVISNSYDTVAYCVGYFLVSVVAYLIFPQSAKVYLGITV
ncbi:MAG: hypothetical protein QXZ59_01605 [Nitrososphaeria archaeon]